MVVLGSTGSIGRAALDVARRFHIPIEVLAAGKNVALLKEQAAEFKPKIVISRNDGEQAILDAIERSKSDLVLNALSGSAGLKPTLKAIERGKRLALANKESLVIAGKFIDISKISAIDSEHFGLWYLLRGRDKSSIKELILTASGGALRDLPIDRIENAPIEDVLRHPNWRMGAKITIDSATMVNKLFEVLEARWLFGRYPIGVYVERSSSIHALARFADGSLAAQFAPSDMRLSIAFALLGDIREPFVGEVDLLSINNLRFEEISLDRYPAWSLKDRLLNEPELGAILNAANEIAVNRYQSGEISFGDIHRIVLAAFDKFGSPPKSAKEALELHGEVSAWACAEKRRIV